MRLYYHVFSIGRKECKFKFSYVRNEKEDVIGSATVDFTTPSRSTVFDPKSEMCLSDDEKKGIVAYVLKHI